MAFASAPDSPPDSPPETPPEEFTRVTRITDGKGGGFIFSEDPDGNDVVKFNQAKNRYELSPDTEKKLKKYPSFIFANLVRRESTLGKETDFRVLEPIVVTKEPDGTFKYKERGAVEEFVKKDQS